MKTTDRIPPPTDPASNDLLRLALEQVDEPAVVVLNNRDEIAGWNAGAKRLYGFDAKEVLGTAFTRLCDPQEVTAGLAKQHLAAAAASGHDAFECGAVRINGTAFRAAIALTALRGLDGRACGFAATVRDVTAERRRENELRSLVELSLTAIVLVNRRGEIVTVNAQTEKMFGYDRSQLEGRLVEILVPDRYKLDHPKNRAAFFADPRVRPMGAGRDLYGRRSDGSEFPVEIGLSPIETAQGPAAVGSIVDITARKTAEQLARTHLADLAHVARLSTVGQMFSELAHEINQPLAAAANYARACVAFARSGQGATQEQMTEWMEKTVAQTTRAIDIVKRLGAFVKKDGGARTLVNVNRLIEQVVSLSVPALQTPVEGGPPVGLDLQLDESLPRVHADLVQIEQVLLNLVRNAIEALQEVPAAHRRLAVRTMHDADFVRVAVADSGPGISEANQKRLFEPYFTTKAGGMGLGLSISRSIIQDHDGRLEVSTSPEGTTFQFSLPKAGRNR